MGLLIINSSPKATHRKSIPFWRYALYCMSLVTSERVFHIQDLLFLKCTPIRLCLNTVFCFFSKVHILSQSRIGGFGYSLPIRWWCVRYGRSKRSYIIIRIYFSPSSVFGGHPYSNNYLERKNRNKKNAYYRWVFPATRFSHYFWILLNNLNHK